MRLASFSSVLGLFVSLLGNGCSKEITRSTVAVIFSVKGNVVFGDSERNDFQPVTPKSRIQAGDVVRTSDGAAINLALISGVFVQLTENSEIKIEDLRLTKDGNDTADRMVNRRAWIRLDRGRIVCSFSQSDKTASDFGIASGQMTLRPASDCLFSIWTDGTTSRATCERGEVSASADAQPPLKIAAGYFSQWPTASKEPIAASSDAGAQMDITIALNVEPELMDQAAAW
ncbi:MAG: FecR domain-containing protein [Candidatus Udaeobacter sp.]